MLACNQTTSDTSPYLPPSPHKRTPNMYSDYTTHTSSVCQQHAQPSQDFFLASGQTHTANKTIKGSQKKGSPPTHQLTDTHTAATHDSHTLQMALH